MCVCGPFHQAFPSSLRAVREVGSLTVWVVPLQHMGPPFYVLSEGSQMTVLPLKSREVLKLTHNAGILRSTCELNLGP